MAGAHTATRTEQSATSWENLVTLLGGLWLTAGLFIDGYAHANIIDTATEDFFTPWHGIFYSGFTFSAGWITYLMYRRQNPNGMRSWIPPGYGWAVVGLGVFAVGGIGDLLWHQTFGVETGLDALLSPTHIFLFCGLVLILAAPLQAVRRTGGSLWMAVASMTMLSLLAAFFTTYARPDAWTLEIAAIENSTWASWAIASIIVTTLLMGASALYLLQRFRSLPFGFLTTLWAVPAIGEAFALGGTRGPAIAGGVVAGMVGDVLLRAVPGSRRRRAGVALSVGAMAGWTAWTIVGYLVADQFRLEIEVWTGQIVLSGLVVAALTMLAFGDQGEAPEPPGEDHTVAGNAADGLADAVL